MKVLVLGINGFIGHHLTRAILEKSDWDVFGMDLGDDRLDFTRGNPRFHFVEGDVGISREWIEYHIKKCDVVLPLVAIATPKLYVEDPVRVFELDFEENLKVVRQCLKYGKRIIFPSTSEVYGMCADPEFLEEESPLVYGPIKKERWIYACAKQLLDRVIWAYGHHDKLSFTLFRPFNWIGPRLDSIEAAKEGSSRVVTQFIADLYFQRPIALVDGGSQRRCFTYVDDGIDALMRIIADQDRNCQGRIFNVGNPANDCSVKELAMMLKELFMAHPDHRHDKVYSELRDVPSESFYGKGYQDITTRKPSIEKARKLLGWEPKVALQDALQRTLNAFLAECQEPAPGGACKT
ncbi:MAG TPA: bifunctional UDP-4-keto-pentose/UDP-xylose synthase [bacterium]|nr:bifunctional UDP-4-keto-pentose/UDP-xylose synthase [bacterium]